MDERAEELICKVVDGCATAAEKEELRAMARSDPEVKAEWDQQQTAVATIRSVGLRELQDEEVEAFSRSVYSRLECRVGWLLIGGGLLALTGFILYEMLTDPEVHSVLRVGLAAVIVGFVLLLSGVWRCRRRVARTDAYKEVVR
jgi:hypothetical protein